MPDEKQSTEQLEAQVEVEAPEKAAAEPATIPDQDEPEQPTEG